MTDTISRPLTAKGKRTRDRIVAAAAGLMVDRGVASVSLDEVGRATSTSKSQMYHYFESKDQLVVAVVEHVGVEILTFQGSLLGEMESLDDVGRWADAVVAHQRQGDSYCGCPLGTLASELSGDPRHPQRQIEEAFETWEELLAEPVPNGGERSARRGRRPASSGGRHPGGPEGGLLMAKATQDEASLRIPLEAAVDYLRSFLASSESRGELRRCRVVSDDARIGGGRRRPGPERIGGPDGGPVAVTGPVT